jgi:hypothetical protein
LDNDDDLFKISSLLCRPELPALNQDNVQTPGSVRDRSDLNRYPVHHPGHRERLALAALISSIYKGAFCILAACSRIPRDESILAEKAENNLNSCVVKISRVYCRAILRSLNGRRRAYGIKCFFLEAKDPDGSLAVAGRQALQNGTVSARVIHSLQFFGANEPAYEGNSYTISSTYHGGTLKMYTTHLTELLRAATGIGHVMNGSSACRVLYPGVMSD